MKPRTHCVKGHPFDTTNTYNYTRKDGRIARQCRQCQRTKCAKQYQASPESYADGHLRRKYGKTLADKATLFAAQKGKCANGGCGHQFSSLSDAQWDHAHATSLVRGLLCAACNRGLGILQENPKILRGLIAYLEKFASEFREA